MKFLTISKCRQYLPEIVLFTMISVAFFWELIETGKTSYLMMAFASLLTILVVTKNKYLAAILSVILGPGSCYFLLAVVSEYLEFPHGILNGLELLLVGGTLFTTLLVISIFLPRKYFT